jgi:diguanylate cyclase (GGDEF)-like protein/PAS domain S-box-containing protein
MKILAIPGDVFTRRIVFPLVGMITFAIILVVGFVIVSAGGQNRLEVESSTKLAETAFVVKKREMARNLKDYAVWEDAFKNLHENMNFEWASTDGNVGANIYNGLGYDMAYVISPTGEIKYSVVDGVPQLADLAHGIPKGLNEISQASRKTLEPIISMMHFGNDLLMVSATAILPPSLDLTTLPPDKRTVLIFAKKIDETFLSRVSGEYLLDDLSVIADISFSKGAYIPLTGENEEVLGYITWTPRKPGFELLKLLLPPLIISIVILCAFAGLVVRKVHKSTADLEESARTVESYAETLEESESRFRDVAEASSDWIWECGPGLQFVYLSSRFSDVTGISAATVLGRQIEHFFSSDSGSDGWNKLHTETQQRDSFRDLRCSYRDAGGRSRICRLAGRPVTKSGSFVGFRGTATDITEEVEANAKASHLALHDALTELPNRLLFRERLEMALKGSQKKTARIAVLFLDLDNFKEVNDTLGHGVGDILLQQLAKRLDQSIRPTETVARLGGDEFAIIQVGVNQPVEASALSRRLLESVKSPFQIDGQEIHVGVSIGVAIPEPGDTPEKVLKNADIALYQSKQAGRGTVRFFEAKMDTELQFRKAMESDLRQAMLKNQFELHFQPVTNLENGEIVAAEALLRWIHPVRGIVAPSEFIPLTEETGLIISLGEWVLRAACRQALEWPDIRIAVNLSPVQFRNKELAATIGQILQETGLPPSRLELEITESVLINDATSALAILSSLKSMGVRIAMDDFGTGYSSLGYLNSFPFDKIKIDRSFISKLSDEDKSLAIVRSVVGLGNSLNMITTAEGVETAEQANYLQAEGCDQVQGFYFGRPMPAIEFHKLLEDRRLMQKNPAIAVSA